MSFKNSIAEVKYFQRHPGPTIDGSTPISEIPVMKENNIMFAIKFKDRYLTTENYWAALDEGKSLKWFKYFLEAEESCSKLKEDCHAVSCEEILNLLNALLKTRDVRIKQLLSLTAKHLGNFENHITPEHADETSQT